MARPLKVCVCGGGRSAHTMAGLAAANPDTDVTVLALYKDEAEKWNNAIANSQMVINTKGPTGTALEIKSKPNCVSKDPADVVPECDLVILAVPAFAHEEYLKAIAGHIDKKSVIVGLPGLPGFEYLCKSLLGELTDQITIMSYELSPWICELVAYGQTVNIIRTAKSLNGSILRGKAIPRKPSLMSLQTLLGYDPALKQVKHFLEILFTSFSFVHPAIMYGKWKDWDGKAIAEEPGFFDIDENTAQIIENCGKEYQDVAHAISGKKPEVDLTEIQDIYNWTIAFYKDDIEDSTNLQNAFCTNKAYSSVKHPMIKNRSRFTPEFNCRYLQEDIPMGMVVVRGLAEIVDVETPVCDQVLDWCQNKLGKQYLVDGKLTGPDVSSSRAPQRFGFTTLEEVLSGRKNGS